MKIICTILMVFFFITNVMSEELTLRVDRLSKMPKKHSITSIKYDPFKNGEKVIVKTFKQKKEENTLHVTSILNNKVFINSKWYKVGEETLGYKILQINENSILAKNNNKIVKLGMSRKNKLLKVRNK